MFQIELANELYLVNLTRITGLSKGDEHPLVTCIAVSDR